MAQHRRPTSLGNESVVYLHLRASGHCFSDEDVHILMWEGVQEGIYVKKEQPLLNWEKGLRVHLSADCGRVWLVAGLQGRGGAAGLGCSVRGGETSQLVNINNHTFPVLVAGRRRSASRSSKRKEQSSNEKPKSCSRKHNSSHCRGWLIPATPFFTSD